MSISDGELNRLRAGEEEPAAGECPGEASVRLLAPRVFLAGESAAVEESVAGCLLEAAARIVLLDGETGGKEGDFALAAPRVFLAGESMGAAAATVGLLREGDRLEAAAVAAAPRVYLPGESIIAAADGGALEGDFLLAFLRVIFSGESNTSGGGGGAAPAFVDGLMPAPSATFEGGCMLALLRVFVAGESIFSGGGGDLAAPAIFDGFVPAPALGGGLDLSSCNGLLGGVLRGGAGGG